MGQQRRRQFAMKLTAVHDHWPHLKPCGSTCLLPTAAATEFSLKWRTTITNTSDRFSAQVAVSHSAILDFKPQTLLLVNTQNYTCSQLMVWAAERHYEAELPCANFTPFTTYLSLAVWLRQPHLPQHLRPLLHHEGPFVGVRADVTVMLWKQ